jgi:hypothetical protein
MHISFIKFLNVEKWIVWLSGTKHHFDCKNNLSFFSTILDLLDYVLRLCT